MAQSYFENTQTKDIILQTLFSCLLIHNNNINSIVTVPFPLVKNAIQGTFHKNLNYFNNLYFCFMINKKYLLEDKKLIVLTWRYVCEFKEFRMIYRQNMETGNGKCTSKHNRKTANDRSVSCCWVCQVLSQASKSLNLMLSLFHISRSTNVSNTWACLLKESASASVFIPSPSHQRANYHSKCLECFCPTLLMTFNILQNTHFS